MNLSELESSYYQRQQSPVLCWDDKLIASQKVLILGVGYVGTC